MSATVTIVAYESCTPLGDTAPSTAAAVRAGISRLAEHEMMLDDTGAPLKAAVVQTIDPHVMGVDRLTALTRGPIEWLAQYAWLQEEPDLVVFVAVPEHRPGFTAAHEKMLLMNLTAGFAPIHPRSRIRVVERGHAGALAAIDQAAAIIAHGQSRIVVVVGVDSYFGADTIDALLGDRRLMTEATRSAFPPGEAAGIVVLMNDADRRRHGLSALAIVRGSAVGREGAPITGDSDCFGLGMTDVVERACASLRLPDERVREIYLDINGERYRTEEWGFVALRAYAIFDDPSTYIAPVDQWGDIGAATGALMTILAGQSWARGYARGSPAILCAGSDSGLRAAVVLEQGAA